MAMTLTLTYGAASLSAAFVAALAMAKHFGPIPAMCHAQASTQAHKHSANLTARKVDDRVPPRRRRL